jgi:hypothetical protein
VTQDSVKKCSKGRAVDEHDWLLRQPLLKAPCFDGCDVNSAENNDFVGGRRQPFVAMGKIEGFTA